MLLSCSCCSSSNNRWEGVAVQIQCWQQFNQVNNNTDATHIRVVQWLVGNGHISAAWQRVVQKHGVVAVCAALERTSSSLRRSVIFCSIGGVLVSKLCGEAKTHEISITQKLFLEIPPRNVLIILLAYFSYFLSLNLGKLIKWLINSNQDLFLRNLFWVLEKMCSLASQT